MTVLPRQENPSLRAGKNSITQAAILKLSEGYPETKKGRDKVPCTLFQPRSGLRPLRNGKRLQPYGQRAT